MGSVTEEQISKFREDGCVVLENFLTSVEVESLKAECHQLIDDMNPDEHNSVFETGNNQKSDDYFMESTDKIRYFYEAGVQDETGRLLVDKHKALNKIGHALHFLNPAFRKITFSDKVKSVAKALGLVEPIVAQSMYIFKQPGIGGEVVPHQDASFLHTEPIRLFALWIALEDVTLENACLWFIPGSHKEGKIFNDRCFVRNPDVQKDGKSMIYTNPMKEFDQSMYIPVPVKKGSCVLIDGLVVHKSEQNRSSNSRHIYTFHMYDAHNTTYSNKNWIQPTSAGTFAKLYTTNPEL